jgi:DNA-binding transcriptional MerR regulator
MLLDIVEVAQRSGLPASTLRYYEEKGLIGSVGRRGLRRLFEARVVGQLALIQLGRTAGFSLEEIAAMLTGDGAPHIDRVRLLAKADELDRSIATLVAMRDSLRHAARCPAPTHMDCPQFRRLLRLAGRLRDRHSSSLPPRKGQPPPRTRTAAATRRRR